MRESNLKDNIPRYEIHSVKEFKELIKNIKEAYIVYECEKCHGKQYVYKAYGKGTKSDRLYYEMLKWEDDHPLICTKCTGKENFRKTQALKSSEQLKKEQEIKTAKRLQTYKNKYKEDSSIEYTSYEKLKKAFDNGAKGATIICPECHEKTVYKDRRSLYKYMRQNTRQDLICRGCSISKGKIRENRKRLTTDPEKLFDCTFVNDQEYIGAGYVNSEGNNVKRGDRIKYKFRCNTCGEIFEDTFPCGYEYPITCPNCHPLESGETTTSRIEKEMLAYIQTIYTGKIETNTREIISPYEIDVYLPELKIGFEMNGVYWHSDKFKDRNYHLRKYLMSKEKGVRLYSIFEDDWKFNKEIVKNFIKARLDIYDFVININECVIKEVREIKIVENFLNENNFYGYNENSTINFGLYHNDELVSLISYKLLSKKGGIDYWAISGFCNKKGYKIDNSFEELFRKTHPKGKYFIYSDIGKFNNSSLKELFNYVKSTRPFFYYATQDHRISKKELIKNHPEYRNYSINEIAKEIGCNKVFDCGKELFTYEDI